MKFVDTSGNLSASYYYDGLGERVEKVAGSQSTVYVYDAFGRLAEEYSPATTWSKDYIPFNGQTAVIENATASPCTTCYLSYDYLGTPRLVTDQNASVMARHDYLPFGDEIPAGTAGRGSQFGPYMDNVDQKFTGQVRDAETFNDFFNARYYTAPLMRFLSADPGNAGADPTDPQTWNAYAYVRNNPLAFVDPSGMDPYKVAGCWFQTTAVTTTVGTYTNTSYETTILGCDFSTGGSYMQLTGSGFQNSTSSGNGGGGGTSTQPQQPAKTGTAQRLSCAAIFGQNHSIAAAFGAQNNFAANLFGGNSVSGLVNLGLFVSGSKTPTVSQLASIPLKGAAQGIPVPPGNPGLSGAVGQIRGMAVQGAVSGAYNSIAGVGAAPIELGITAAGTVATPVAQLSTQTLTNVATGVGLAKFAFDLTTFAYGYAFGCN